MKVILVFIFILSSGFVLQAQPSIDSILTITTTKNEYRTNDSLSVKISGIVFGDGGCGNLPAFGLEKKEGNKWIGIKELSWEQYSCGDAIIKAENTVFDLMVIGNYYCC